MCTGRRYEVFVQPYLQPLYRDGTADKLANREPSGEEQTDPKSPDGNAAARTATRIFALELSLLVWRGTSTFSNSSRILTIWPRTSNSSIADWQGFTTRVSVTKNDTVLHQKLVNLLFLLFLLIFISFSFIFVLHIFHLSKLKLRNFLLSLVGT